MLNRRQALSAFAALAAPALLTAAQAAAYTAKTAPDALTRAILANPILTLDPPAGADPEQAINAMFPQLIEQNFARRTSKGVSRLLGNLSAAELRDLGVTYTAAAGAQGRLLDLFALRLTGRELGQLTPYFGYGPVYEAVWRSAPDKAGEFAQHAIANVPSGGPATVDVAPHVGMTITQVYMAYRTAPIGGMAVNAAVYMTAMFASGHFGVAWGIGYGAGTAISYVMQNYAPSLHNAIGSGIHSIVNSISSANTTAALGQAQAAASVSFSLGSLSGMISETGGDYGVCAAWAQMGGNGGGRCLTCYFELY